MTEVFDLGHEIESLRDLKKSQESSFASINEKLKVEVEHYQVLESDTSLLMRQRLTMAQEEVM